MDGNLLADVYWQADVHLQVKVVVHARSLVDEGSVCAVDRQHHETVELVNVEVVEGVVLAVVRTVVEQKTGIVDQGCAAGKLSEVTADSLMNLAFVEYFHRTYFLEKLQGTLVVDKQIPVRMG